MKYLYLCIIVMAFVLSLSLQANAADKTVPSPYGTIQAAINACNPGDTVIVADGDYTGANNKNLDISIAITIKSLNGPDGCTIDCEGSGRGFYIHGSGASGAVIEGFTIHDGYALNGAGIYIYSSCSPTIKNCIFDENDAWYTNGGGIHCNSSCSPTIEDCTFTLNDANWTGGGIFCEAGSDPTITGCIIDNNVSGLAGSGIGINNSDPTIENCEIINNTASTCGGGVSCETASDPVLVNCLITGNSASQKGGGIFAYYDSDPTLTNCTIADNSAADGGGVATWYYSDTVLKNTIIWSNDATGNGDEIWISGATAALYYSCYGNSGGDVSGTPSTSNCITSDPSFVSASDYHLDSDSPCIDDGYNSYNSETYDLDGNWRIINGTIDMGCYEYGVFKDSAASRGIRGPSTGADNVVWGDFNNDGDIDLYVVKDGGSNVLYLNDGDGTFTDSTSSWSAAGQTYSTGACAADYDNDGDLDMLVCNDGGSLYLLRNNVEGAETSNFTEVASAAGLTGFNYSVMATWGDYNNDGYIDVYIVQSSGSCKLFENDGDGTFTDVTSTAGVAGPASGSSAVWCDVNNDILQDIFVIGTGSGTGKMYLNNGDGTFDDISVAAGANREGNSIAVGDVDNDGDRDFYIAKNGWNYLLKNSFMQNQTVTFTNEASTIGMTDPYYAVDCCFADYDNDGWIDLYVTANDGNSCIYRNTSAFASPDFEELDEESGGVNSYNCQGVSAVDIDGDGKQSFYVTKQNGYSALMEQKLNENNWIGIKFVPTASNKSAVGAVVLIDVFFVEYGYRLIRTVTAGSGWGSQGSRDLHIGLGGVTKNNITTMTVIWPSGIVNVVQAESYELKTQVVLLEKAVDLDIYLYDGSVVPDDAQSETDEKEYKEGSVVVWNKEPVKIKVNTSSINEDDKVVLSLDQPAGGDAKIKVWNDENKTSEVTLPEEYDATDLPKELWVEGVNKSSTNVDTGLKLHLKGDTGVKDRVRFTVIWVDIDPKCSDAYDVHTLNEERTRYWDKYQTYDLGAFYSERTGYFSLAVEYRCSITPKDFNCSYSKREFSIKRWIILARLFVNDECDYQKDERKNIDDTSNPEWKDEDPDYDGQEEKLFIFDLDAPGLEKQPDFNEGDVLRVRYNFREYVHFVVGEASVSCSENCYVYHSGAIRLIDEEEDEWDWTSSGDSETGEQKYVEGENNIGTGIIEATWDLNPAVTSIQPNEFCETEDYIQLTIQGDGFLEGAEVELTGPDNYEAASVTVNSQGQLVATFNFSGTDLVPGSYTVTVTNTTDRSGSLTNGVTITEE